MGILAILIAALGGFAVGAAWYMTFSKPWVEAAGVPVDSAGRPKGGSPMPFIIAALCMVLVAGMMRHVFSMAGIEGPAASAVAGLGIGAFFITPWVAMNYAYAMRPRRLTLLDGGYSVLGPTVIGLILGLF